MTITVNFHPTSRCPIVIFFTIATKFLQTSSHHHTSPLPFNSLYFATSYTTQLLLSSQYSTLHSFTSQLCSFATFCTCTTWIHLLRSILNSLLFSFVYFMASYDSTTSCTLQVPFLHISSSSQLAFHVATSLDFMARAFPCSDDFSS